MRLWRWVAERIIPAGRLHLCWHAYPCRRMCRITEQIRALADPINQASLIVGNALLPALLRVADSMIEEQR